MSVIARNLLQLVDTKQAASLTGIRSSRLIAYAEGRINPLASTTRLLRNIYRQVTFSEATLSGMGSAAARSLRDLNPASLMNKIEQFTNAVKNLAEYQGVNEGFIFEGMRLSEKDYDDIILSGERVTATAGQHPDDIDDDDYY